MTAHAHVAAAHLSDRTDERKPPFWFVRFESRYPYSDKAASAFWVFCAAVTL